jgi:hypothetical protein
MPMLRVSSSDIATSGRTIATVALALATLGIAVPYGTATGGDEPMNLNVVEWVGSVLALIVALGLIADLVPRINPSAHATGLVFMLAGFLWMLVTAYQMLAPGDLTFVWRLGHGLADLGWAVLALTVWRLITLRAAAAEDQLREEAGGQ